MAGIRATQVEYPDDLKDAVWQKKKGVLAKAKKTGIGDLLKKAESMSKGINYPDLDVRAYSPNTPKELADAIKKAKALYKDKVMPLQDMMTKIATQCDKAEKENSVLLKGAKSGIADVRKAAQTFRVTLKSVDLEEGITELEKRFAYRQEAAKKHLAPSLTKFAAGAKAFLADPTPDSWNDNIKQQGRSISNSVNELEAYKARFWKDFEAFKGFDLGALGIDTKSETFAKEASAKVREALVQVKEIASFKPG